MSYEKVAQNGAQPFVFQNIYLGSWYRAKVTVIFKPLPKANNSPIGENSPNPVALVLNAFLIVRERV
jgi:hypothetical protein